jgi:hypothetical protein
LHGADHRLRRLINASDHDDEDLTQRLHPTVPGHCRAVTDLLMITRLLPKPRP